MEIKGEAANNTVPFSIKFVLHLKDYCSEMALVPNRLTFPATSLQYYHY